METVDAHASAFLIILGLIVTLTFDTWPHFVHNCGTTPENIQLNSNYHRLMSYSGKMVQK